MSVKAKLAGLEKRMQVRDLKRHCPLCRTRPAEMWTVYPGEPYPISKQPPCPLCGKGAQQIIIFSAHVGGRKGKNTS